MHTPVKFDNIDITRYSNQNYLGVALNSNLHFNFHIDQKSKKYNKMIGLIRWHSVNIACLVITGGIQGNSREQFYDELGLHSLG